MNFKKIIAITCLFIFALTFVGCGNQGTAEKDGEENTKIIVGATPAPHAEILEECKNLLEEKGFELEIKEFTDYITPNIALDEGSIDANFFQHFPYLDDFNEKNDLALISAAKIHFEPLGVYSAELKDLADLPDGAKIAVPNDTTNEARALLLLEELGLIKVDEEKGLQATKQDIENPRNFEIIELEAAQIPRSLDDVAIAVINGNYALGAGLNPETDTLASEDKDSLAADTYANIIAIKPEKKDNPAIKALIEVLTSDSIKNFMEKKYQGSVIPVF